MSPGVSMAAQESDSGRDVELRANSGHGLAIIGTDNSVRAVSGMPSLVANPVRLETGRWYYEVHVSKGGEAVVGWSDKAFFGDWAARRGVGDDTHSWGFNGGAMTPHCRAAGLVKAFGSRWSDGSVIGVAADVDAATISFMLNGSDDAGFGVSYTDIDFDTCVMPCHVCLPVAV